MKNIAKMLEDQIEFNINQVAKEHQERTENRCEYCGAKMREALFIDYENDDCLWENVCSENCRSEGDF